MPALRSKPTVAGRDEWMSCSWDDTGTAQASTPVHQCDSLKGPGFSTAVWENCFRQHCKIWKHPENPLLTYGWRWNFLTSGLCYVSIKITWNAQPVDTMDMCSWALKYRLVKLMNPGWHHRCTYVVFMLKNLPSSQTTHTQRINVTFGDLPSPPA